MTATVNRQTNDELDVSFAMGAGEASAVYPFPVNYGLNPGVCLTPVDTSEASQAMFYNGLSGTGLTLNKSLGLAGNVRAWIRRAR